MPTAGEYVVLLLLAAVSAVGVPGPGDSALIAAGLLASDGELSLPVVLVVAFFGCVVGRLLGYRLGSVGGRPLLERPGPLLGFRSRAIAKGDRLFQRFPRIAPVLAPAPLAGIYSVALPAFLAASVIAATSWTLSTGLVAYFLGPSATDVLNDIGARGVIVTVLLASVGLVYRWLWQRRHHPGSGARPPEHD